MNKTLEVKRTTTMSICWDKSKFNPEFMEHFRKHFYNFETIDEHIEHIAKSYAHDCVDSNGFLEGYGILKDFGVSIRVIDEDTECEEV